ncbi:hypothetical protein IFM89_019749 [Coptis chinensis]|uniref:Trichome birefringence-like N-terminal domain-containing protein n=1 Tax=Coptis chinensis TaxID=261450 RepID=A0A835H7B1_9MAGN|nr:hypothetical protein IFM89_019749 [Coptis chinensis]
MVFYLMLRSLVFFFFFISEKCDMFTGKWIFNNASYPLYNESDCPYISVLLACWKHGRTDLEYWNWRWQPHDYNLKGYRLHLYNGLMGSSIELLSSCVLTRFKGQLRDPQSVALKSKTPMADAEGNW